MPTATDLVTDLPADFEVFGQAVDTAMADLLGGTTGQVLAKNSNTNMDFVWVAQDDSNAIQNAIVDAKGDLIGATAADTPARLAVGTNGQVLTADSSAATGLAWATAGSGLTKILATTFSGVSSYSAPASTFSATYNQYLIMVEITAQSASANIQMRLRAAGTDATTDYQNQEVTGSSTTAAATGGAAGLWDFGSSSTNTRFALKTDLYNPFGTGQHLQISEVFSLNSSSAWVRRALGGRLDIGSSYDAFTLFPASGTITGRIAVYGFAL